MRILSKKTVFEVSYHINYFLIIFFIALVNKKPITAINTIVPPGLSPAPFIRI